jgi:hypothetical protein
MDWFNKTALSFPHLYAESVLPLHGTCVMLFHPHSHAITSTTQQCCPALMSEPCCCEGPCGCSGSNAFEFDAPVSGARVVRHWLRHGCLDSRVWGRTLPLMFVEMVRVYKSQNRCPRCPLKPSTYTAHMHARVFRFSKRAYLVTLQRHGPPLADSMFEMVSDATFA